jgi:anti-anti-sigma regulatory factor
MKMDFGVTQAPGRPDVAVLGMAGDLDASSYLQAIAQAEAAYKGGTRVLLLDLSNTEFVSSSGLVAIHSIALLMQGGRPPDPEQGWAAIRSVGMGQGADARRSLKLINPKPRVASTFAKVGFAEVFEVFPTIDAALAAL